MVCWSISRFTLLPGVAVPKFVDLQTDARKSMMKGVKGALEGAATTIHAKALLRIN